MAQGFKINTAIEVRNKGPGAYSAGPSLYLVVGRSTPDSPKGPRQWVFRFTSPTTGKRREMGLGSAEEGKGGLSLADARSRAARLLADVRSGMDPIAIRDETRAAARSDAAKRAAGTFGAFAMDWIDNNEAQWRNPKHRAQWRSTLKTYCNAIWTLDLDAITTDRVLDVLKPIWTAKPETATRVRQRLERILDAATVKGLRQGANPARWKGHLSVLLPTVRKAGRAHHAALPYKSLPAFIAELKGREGVAARALEFLILTAARSGEVRGLAWSELDLDAKIWTVPGARMKAGVEHRVPLSPRAIEILAMQQPEQSKRKGLVFPSATRDNKPMSDMTLAMVLRRMKTAVTVHGFRSAFRDWGADVAGYDRDILERALAHTINNKTEAAYRRGDAFDRRVKLMALWGEFVTRGASQSNVVPLRSGGPA